jgi:transketolase
VGAPTVILARTRKGRGVAAVEDREDTHGQPLGDPDAAIGELGGLRDLRVRVAPPVTGAALTAQRAQGGGQPSGVSAADGRGPRDRRRLRLVPGRHRDPGPAPWRPPAYQPGDMVAPRTAVGAALAALGDARPDVVVLDGGMSDSTRTSLFAQAHPDRFFECYTAQQMLAAAVGMQARGWVPYAATFAAFLTRAHDFIRMAAVGQASIRLIGSHSGVTVGQDGPAQMALEDIAALRAVHGSTVLCPCDANQAARLTGVLADRPGVSYLRTSQGDSPVLYQPGDRFEAGGSRVLRSSPDDEVTLVAAGITVHEALAAADLLADDGISARVIDAYSVKPIDAATLRAAARDTGRLVTVEDHWPEGGLGDAVLSAFASSGPFATGDQRLPVIRKLAVRAMPGSATPHEQVQLAGIDMASIATAAAQLVAADLA